MIPSSWTNSDPIKRISKIVPFNLATSNLIEVENLKPPYKILCFRIGSILRI